MKLIQIICALLVLTAIASASVSNRDCSLDTKVIGSWKQDGITITQYSITIENHTNKIIKSIHIATDRTLTLRDSSSIWNMEKHSNELTLPAGQSTIAAHSSHTFYCILNGTTRPNLYIKSISF
ncbi:hypothetical protein DDB_G0289363 [Dictyostelium discoideum AX4]|uniref:Carbohydrate binding domain-containing protein n=1 Tax=Dictyostelium discoideum TaxID=44689 RepID=Q54HL5_DICDI|nr:hypothetical protein DDB_G0289363 [Dictyostelium discoideum AX4]EAL62768.1 hypothetical protein DDB_G0289363 [Dictyostelium discoideum AX4]|eukprot:XP_636286.1 hypothetical protein DDB_G0289363 [Dictyostelium discoideum AX4]